MDSLCSVSHRAGHCKAIWFRFNQIPILLVIFQLRYQFSIKYAMVKEQKSIDRCRPTSFYKGKKETVPACSAWQVLTCKTHLIAQCRNFNESVSDHSNEDQFESENGFFIHICFSQLYFDPREICHGIAFIIIFNFFAFQHHVSKHHVF